MTRYQIPVLDLIAALGEPQGVPPGTAADVRDDGRRRREITEHDLRSPQELQATAALGQPVPLAVAVVVLEYLPVLSLPLLGALANRAAFPQARPPRRPRPGSPHRRRAQARARALARSRPAGRTRQVRRCLRVLRQRPHSPWWSFRFSRPPEPEGCGGRRAASYRPRMIVTG